MKKQNKISMPVKDFIKEHKKLVNVLKSPSHKDDLDEAKEQGDELKEVLPEKLEKMSRPKIRFTNLPKVSTRPDQQIALVQNDKQRQLLGHKVANQRHKDKIVTQGPRYQNINGELVLIPETKTKISNQPARDVTAKRVKNTLSSTNLGVVYPNSKKDGEPYSGAAIAGKLRSKFEQKDDPEFKAKQSINDEKDNQAVRDYNTKLKSYLEENKGKLSYADLTRFQKENRPKKTITRGKIKETKDLAPEQMANRGRSVDATIEHEAAHGLFAEINRHYGPEAVHKIQRHLTSSFHPETKAVVSNWLTSKHGYDSRSPSFNEEILNHSRDILVNPSKREKFRKFVGDEKYNDHIKNLKRGVQEMHNRSKAITPEWLSSEQQEQAAPPKKLAASEKLTKARVDQGKSIDEKRQARNTRAESWERENYGMGSGKSSNPTISRFLHNAKLHQIKNSPKPKLDKAEKEKPKLIGSAPNHEQIKKVIGRYWYGDAGDIKLTPNNEGTHDVHNGDRKIEGYKVREHKGRVRFEYHKPKLDKSLPLEHYSSHEGLKQIDPKYKKTGVDARVKGWDTEHPHSFYYHAGTAPEDIVQSQAKSKYLVEIPDHVKLYDIGVDPENLSDQVRNENNGAFSMDKMHQKIKESGHEGFHNSTHPQLSNVVALYHSQPVKEEKAR